jgi:hypothetical protein
MWAQMDLGHREAEAEEAAEAEAEAEAGNDGHYRHRGGRKGEASSG